MFSALYAVAPNIVARIPVRDRALIEDAMPSDLKEFSAHIILEEEILGPYMTDDEFNRLVSDHEYFKRNRKDTEGWAAHGEWEKAIFSRISSGKRVKRK